jgi:chromosome partitioning protein
MKTVFPLLARHYARGQSAKRNQRHVDSSSEAPIPLDDFTEALHDSPRAIAKTHWPNIDWKRRTKTQ